MDTLNQQAIQNSKICKHKWKISVVLIFLVVFYLIYNLWLGKGYYTLGGRVFYRLNVLADTADSSSFKVLEKGFARDMNYTYYKGFQFGGGNSESFQVLNNIFARDNGYGYIYLPDGRLIRLPNSDGKSFELASRPGYAKDFYKYYYFDGKDFYVLQSDGFQFIDNNERYDARDKDHFYLKGKMIEETPEYQENLKAMTLKINHDEIVNKQQAEDKLRIIMESRHAAIEGKEIKVEEFMKIASSSIKENLAKVSQPPPYYPNNMQEHSGEIKYKIFRVVASPNDPELFAVLYGLDPDFSFNQCCQKPHGLFLTDGKNILDNGSLNYVSGEYGYSRSSNMYFDYESIGDIRWSTSTLYYDVVINCGNSVKFTGYCNGKSLDNSLLKPYLSEINTEDQEMITDVRKLELPSSDLAIKMIRAEILHRYPEDTDGLGLYDVKEIFYSSPGQKFQAVVFGLKGLPGHGVLVTDGSKALDMYFDYFDPICLNGCGGSIAIKNVKWDSYYFKFNVEKCSEEGCKTESQMIYPDKSVLQ